MSSGNSSLGIIVRIDDSPAARLRCVGQLGMRSCEKNPSDARARCRRK